MIVVNYVLLPVITYSKAFGEEIVELAEKDENIVGNNSSNERWNRV